MFILKVALKAYITGNAPTELNFRNNFRTVSTILLEFSVKVKIQPYKSICLPNKKDIKYMITETLL